MLCIDECVFLSYRFLFNVSFEVKVSMRDAVNFGKLLISHAWYDGGDDTVMEASFVYVSNVGQKFDVANSRRGLHECSPVWFLS